MRGGTNVTLKHLHAFVAVAREASFTRAASRLALSQPALTIQINQFEEELGVRLFDRTTRRVMLTDTGAAFLPVAERLLDDLDAAIADVRETAECRRGRVSVAALPSVARKIMPDAVAAFQERYPAISVHLNDSNASGVQRRVSAKEVDFGITSMWEHDQDLVFEPLIRDPFGLVCHAGHPLAAGRGPIPWKALAGERFLGLAPDTGIRPLIQSVADLPEAVRQPQVEVSNITGLEGMLGARLGVSVLPELAVPDHQRDDLVFRPVSDPPLTRDICLITRRGRSLSPAAENMRQFILGQVRARGDGNTVAGPGADG